VYYYTLIRLFCQASNVIKWAEDSRPLVLLHYDNGSFSFSSLKLPKH